MRAGGRGAAANVRDQRERTQPVATSANAAAISANGRKHSRGRSVIRRDHRDLHVNEPQTLVWGSFLSILGPKR